MENDPLLTPLRYGIFHMFRRYFFWKLPLSLAWLIATLKNFHLGFYRTPGIYLKWDKVAFVSNSFLFSAYCCHHKFGCVRLLWCKYIGRSCWCRGGGCRICYKIQNKDRLYKWYRASSRPRLVHFQCINRFLMFLLLIHCILIKDDLHKW